MSDSQVFAIMNRKGGVGKTTTAVTLAAGLAEKVVDKGQFVLLIDLDPQGNCATSLGLKPTASGAGIAKVLDGDNLKENIISASRDGVERPNLFVIPASDALAVSRQQVVTRYTIGLVTAATSGGKVEGSPDRILEERLAYAKQVFRYIIIDCPPSLDVLRPAVYRFADQVIVPVKVDFLGTAGTVLHTENIIQAQAEGIDISVAWIVPTFYRKQQVLARQMLESIKSIYGRAVTVPIPASVKLEQAPASGGGLTVFEYAPDSAPAVAYSQVVDLIYGGQKSV